MSRLAQINTIALISLFLFASAQAADKKIGYESSPAFTTMIHDITIGDVDTADFSGVLDSITAYVTVINEACSVKFGVITRYETADTVIDTSAHHTIGVSVGWNTFPLLESGELVAGRVYTIVMWGDTVGTGEISSHFTLSGAAENWAVKGGSDYSSAWPAIGGTFGGLEYTADRDVSIYAWYTTVDGDVVTTKYRHGPAEGAQRQSILGGSPRQGP